MERVRQLLSISTEHSMVREGSRIMRTATRVVRRGLGRSAQDARVQTTVIRDVRSIIGLFIRNTATSWRRSLRRERRLTRSWRRNRRVKKWSKQTVKTSHIYYWEWEVDTIILHVFNVVLRWCCVGLIGILWKMCWFTTVNTMNNRGLLEVLLFKMQSCAI